MISLFHLVGKALRRRGEISTPNITPDKAAGGEWSDDDFYRALHQGVGRHNEYLYPVFPFLWFTNVSRDDVLAAAKIAAMRKRQWLTMSAQLGACHTAPSAVRA